jgi:hypothetical protein
MGKIEMKVIKQTHWLRYFGITTVSAIALFQWVSFSSVAQALTLVTNRGALAGSDRLDWSSLGKVFDPFAPDPSAFLPNSFSAVSVGNLPLNVSIPPSSLPGVTPPFVFQTSFPPNGIPTNYADGDFILLGGLQPGAFPAPGNGGPIAIAFDTPVAGAGTQIAVDDTPAFTAFVEAFDSNNRSLGRFSAPGTSSTALDNSALFLGVRSETPNISRVVYSTSVTNRAIAINALSLSSASASVSVPEPSFVLGFLLVGALGIRSVKAKKN